VRLALLGSALVALLPLSASARECTPELGRGWPPAVGNYGGAVEQLFGQGAVSTLSLVTLPVRGVETGVSLLSAAQGDWTLRVSRASERVYSWVDEANGSGVRLRTERAPESYEIPIPAALARRLVKEWNSALGQMAPQDRSAPVLDGEVLSFVVDGVRYSGKRPSCGAGELLMQQAALLIEAGVGKEKKREKRWNQIESSLDELQQTLTGAAG
jgi:hypothetical protein